MTSEPRNACARWRARLVAFADGALESDDHAAAAAHVAACDDCRDALARERDFGAWLQTRWPAAGPAPAALRAQVASILKESPAAGGAPARVADRPAWLRALGSPWGPRLAMAAVLALAVLVPVLWRGGPVPALVATAAAQHACHAPVPGEPLPPCCTALAAAIGDLLGPPSPGVRVPGLQAAGLAFTAATRCTFAPAEVNLLSYADAAGGRFSLYMSDQSTREFKTLRAADRGGIASSRTVVPGGPDHPAYAVTLWQRAGLVWTWVGPDASPAYAAALEILQSAP